MSNLKGKVIIITGSTSGIGLAAAKELAIMGATIVLVARNRLRGEIALKDVIKYSNNKNIDLLMCDFSSPVSIVAFTDTFKSKYNRLDVLINNAGMMSSKRAETELGIEMTFAVNHLGYFITTNLLLEMLKETPGARIVVVASDLHYRGVIDIHNLMHKDDYDGFTAYSDSKLANFLFTYSLADRLKNRDTTINVVHPGVIKTKFGIEDRNSDKTFPMGRISPEDGARSLIHLAISPELKGVSGKYFNQLHIEQSSAMSYDKALGEQLWQKSVAYSTKL